MLRILGGLFMGIFALAAGCGGTPPTAGNTDLGPNSSADMGISDMAVYTGPDMVTTLPIPPGCNTQTAVTGTQAYTALTLANNTRCMGGKCHNTGIPPLFSSKATMREVMISKPSTASGMPYITPGNPDRSFMMYKIRGLQTSVRDGGGSQMPKGGVALTNAEACMVYNWILQGAKDD